VVSNAVAAVMYGKNSWQIDYVIAGIT
jgi:hypothetical protein